MTRRWVLEGVRLIALFEAGLAIALHYGRMGFMPLDQSICFDGGWRILCGQVPFRDYTAPNGFPVHALQALFFAVFGVSWFAYCLHAAVINGLFVVLVDRLLVLLGLERWASTVFALCSAFVLYPPFGVPYMDQHAFFFSFAAIVAAVGSAVTESQRARTWCATCVFPLLALAYLSKQIPSVFFVPVALLVPLFARGRAKDLFRSYALGAMYATAAVAGIALVLRVDWGLVDTYWRQLPSDEGARRLGYVPSVSAVVRRFVETLTHLKMSTPWLALMVGMLVTFASLSAFVVARRASEWRRPLGAGLLSLFLLLACLGFVALTSNQKELGVPLVFASFGAACAAMFAFADFAKEQYANARWIARIIVLALVAIAIRDAVHFARSVDATRVADDITFDAALADASAGELPHDLAFLRWSVPKKVTVTPAELRDLADFLRGREGGLFLLGDCGILYGLARKPSVSPSLWFHPGLTLPRPYDRGFARYERTLVERIERLQVRWIVLEGEHPWVGYAVDPNETPPKAAWLGLDTFPKLAQLVAERKVGERAFGSFRVIELR